MRHEELAHVLRAAAKITDDPGILVLGSQSILGTYGEDQLPGEAWISVEADLAFLDDSDAHKAEQVDGAIGELSPFHLEHNYYAQGVEVSTAVLPEGWRDRVVPFDSQAAEPAVAVCLERHDLVVSKLVAMREKDRQFARALIEADLVDLPTLLDRTELLGNEHSISRRAVREWIDAIGRRLGKL